MWLIGWVVAFNGGMDFRKHLRVDQSPCVEFAKSYDKPGSRKIIEASESQRLEKLRSVLVNAFAHASLCIMMLRSAKTASQ
jgi:hypothetical protein